MAIAGASIERQGDPPRFAEELGWLSNETIEPLRRNEELGQALNFGPAVDSLKVIREMLEAFAWQDPKYDRQGLVGEVASHLQEVKRSMDGIRDFSPTEGGPTQRQNFITQLDNERSWFVQQVGILTKGIEAARAASAVAELERSRDEVKRAAEEAQQALATIREAAGEKGTKELAQYFRTQAEGHATTADLFLKGAGAGIVALLVVAWFYFFYDPITLQPQSTGDWIEFLRQLLPRLFALGVVAYLIRFATRGYSINKHLQVTNEQRSNILRTYPELIAAGQTEVQKDRIAVLLAQAAVASVDSGYLKQSEDKGLDSQILAMAELLRR